MLLVTSSTLTILALLALPVVITPILVIGRHVRRLSRAYQDRVADLSAFAAESISAVDNNPRFWL